MFRWYQNAVRCYVYLFDVAASGDQNELAQRRWEAAFRHSRWFRRGWTLQELLAPGSVEFFSREGTYLGSKKTLEGLLHEITTIPVAALPGQSLSQFPVDERLRWTTGRNTKRQEDEAYCLLGIFDIFMPLIYGEGNNAMKRLKEEIEKRSKSSITSPAHVHWLVAPSPNPLFTGRDDILQELDDVVVDAIQHPEPQKRCRIVVTGMGGQGKSEICLQIAHRHRHRFWAVFWIDISTTDLAERSFLDIAHKLSMSAPTWKDTRLGIANLKHPWLLVLDNADDPEVDYQQYFPDGPLGVVLLTSRNEECQRYTTAQTVALEGLAETEAQDLLLKAAQVPPDQHSAFEKDAGLVARLLQSHPLALIQAGAYIARGHCTLADYPQVYERQRQRLLMYRPKQARSRYGDVYATFEASADIIKASESEAAQDALQLLPLLAVCGPSRLPLPLFEAGWRGAKSVPRDMDDNAEDDRVLLLTSWHIAHLPSLVNAAGDEWDSYRLIEAVQLLKAFSLVSTDSQGGFLSVSMHPLVHVWARDRQEKDKWHESWLQMGCLMAVGSEDAVVWTKHEQQLQSHIEALVEWEADVMFAEEPPVMVVRVAVNCGWVLRRLRSAGKVFLLLETIFDHLRLDQLNVERRWQGVYDLKGRNLVDYGKVKDAVPILEGLVKINEQTLAADHPDRLSSQHALAIAYEANGQVKEAVAILEAVVKIREQTLAADHPDRLASLHNLSTMSWELGDWHHSLWMMKRVVATRRNVLDSNHPDRLKSEAWLEYFESESREILDTWTLQGLSNADQGSENDKASKDESKPPTRAAATYESALSANALTRATENATLQQACGP